MAFGFLLPKDGNFFDLFDKQADYAVQSATHFVKMVADFKVTDTEVEIMKDIEHHGDQVTHQIMEQLDKTFITPFDREDIHALAKELDDIIDMLYTITKRLRVYKILSADRNLAEFSRVIEMSVKGVAQAVKGLRDIKNAKEIRKACIEVNSLENLGDKMRDDMLGELFEKHAKDPVAVIKWKDIYQDAETVLDVCEDAVHVVESILVKQA
jgi:predicted phosphate transport protein (TIGR00153 family)